MRRGTIPDLATDESAQQAEEPAAPTRPAALAKPEPMRTSFDFELPRGFLDLDGGLHKTGTMRLATARDELGPLWDDRVRENPAYLTVVILSRVVTRLGTYSDDRVTPSVIENLFATDLAFLQDLYRRINTEGHTRVLVACPSCGEHFTVDTAGSAQGERR
jgi:hypothetical protein